MSYISPSNPLPPVESGSETEGENSSAITAPPAHPSFPRPPHTAGVPNPRLPSSWSAPSGANSAFPKDADEKLKGELNFVPWSKLFLGAVEYIGCKDILSGRIPCPEPTTDEYIVWNTMNSFLNVMLCRCIHPSMIPSISKMTSACEAYNFIARTHGPQGSGLLMAFFVRLRRGLPLKLSRRRQKRRREAINGTSTSTNLSVSNAQHTKAKGVNDLSDCDSTKGQSQGSDKAS
ncbi:hypothetical protein DFJ43DRAFT_1150496 [Lentinula guzmanii]|uniref:Uncharacterized protein n=1 Tax=Lentinula guzmanii TaxID=2804957 RepID=A0AA38JFP2_9AGAR|nr:hypothetical protein DFJ43DRAFT_1150496 [Lentinula guzmanii]